MAVNNYKPFTIEPFVVALGLGVTAVYMIIWPFSERVYRSLEASETIFQVYREKVVPKHRRKGKTNPSRRGRKNQLHGISDDGEYGDEGDESPEQGSSEESEDGNDGQPITISCFRIFIARYVEVSGCMTWYTCGNRKRTSKADRYLKMALKRLKQESELKRVMARTRKMEAICHLLFDETPLTLYQEMQKQEEQASALAGGAAAGAPGQA